MKKVEVDGYAKNACNGYVLACERTGRTIASFRHKHDIEEAMNKINRHDKLIKERDELLLALKTVNEVIKGNTEYSVDEIDTSEMDLLISKIQGSEQ